MPLDPKQLPRDVATLQKIVLDLAAQLDRSSTELQRSIGEQNKYQSLLRDLLEAQRNPKSDASITVSWCFPDEQSPLSLKVLERLKAGEVAIGPPFWSFEVLNSLLIDEKRGGISQAQTQSFLDDLKALGPAFDSAKAEQVFGATSA